MTERSRMSGEGKVVCVTGASGYIASWLVKQLLQCGYTVKATVRDPNDPKIKCLRALDGEEKRLHFFKANLLEEGSFDTAVDGCEGVFHTASPVVFSANDPQTEIIDPAVKGTLNVLRSCAKVHSVKRVVVTSSLTSVSYNENPKTPDVVIDETWFSSPAFCKESKNWYPLSKTLAEEAAWKFAKDNGIDLVTMHPGLVIGPFFQPKPSLSLEVILNLINGVQIFPGPYRLVDVRDVAYAHIQALEVPTASGRYVLAERVIQIYDIMKLLQEHYPTIPLTENTDDPMIKYLQSLDGAKERLHFFKANLLEEGSFDSAVHECDGVFHTASPVILSPNDPQAELIDPAVKGTLNVLRSCAKVHSVRRVVVTSSLSSVSFNENPKTPDVVIDETWFSSPAFCKQSKNWYPLSKTLAEEAVWKFAEENGIELVTINPGLVIGPFFQPMPSVSLEVILKLINNGVEIFPSPYRFVDVRDVAYAHIQALEIPTASGRYVLVERVTQPDEIMKLLQEHYPTLQLTEKFKDAKHEPTYKICQEKAKSLGVNFIPWEVSLGDTLKSFKVGLP